MRLIGNTKGYRMEQVDAYVGLRSSDNVSE